MTLEKATATLKSDLITYGVMMVKEGDADGLVAGACHATADTLRPALQILKTAPGTELVSGFFIMDVPNCEYGANGTFLFADCGLNQDPTSEELAAIANSSSDSFRALTGEEPKIAMLSHSTKGSAKHALVDKVTAAVSIAHEKYPELNLDGELQLDAAIVPSVAKSKAQDSKVAGQANVLIFPNLDCGNIGYKLVQRLAKAEAYGPDAPGYRKTGQRPIPRLLCRGYRRRGSPDCRTGPDGKINQSETGKGVYGNEYFSYQLRKLFFKVPAHQL